MALSEATLKAIYRAQNAMHTSTLGAGMAKYSESYNKAYAAQVELNRQEQERIDKIKMDSLDNLDELNDMAGDLGYFEDIGAPMLKVFSDQYADTYNLKSQYDTELAQRDINKQFKQTVQPFVTATTYQKSAIGIVSDEKLNKVLKGQKYTDANGEEYDITKYDVIEQIAKTKEVYHENGDTGFVVCLEEKEKIFQGEGFSRCRKSLKVSVKNLPDLMEVNTDALQKYDEGLETIIKAAATSNATPAQQAKMAKDIVSDMSFDEQLDMMANYHSNIMDDYAAYVANPAELTAELERRIIGKIDSRYDYEPPEIEQPDDPTVTELKYQSGKKYYDSQVKKIDGINYNAMRGPRNPSIDWYGSKAFIDQLPDNFEAFVDEDTGQVVVNNTDFKTQNQIIENQIIITPGMSLNRVKNKLKSRIENKEDYFQQYKD